MIKGKRIAITFAIQLMIIVMAIQTASAQISDSFFHALPANIRPLNAKALTAAEKVVLMDSLHNYPLKFVNETRQLAAQLAQYASGVSDISMKIMYYSRLCTFYSYNGPNDSIIHYVNQILQYAGEKPEYEKYGVLASAEYANVLSDSARYDSSISYSTAALKWCLKNRDTSLLVFVYNGLSDEYGWLHQFDQALHYNQLSLNLFPAAATNQYRFYYLQRIKLFEFAYENTANEDYADSAILLSKQAVKNWGAAIINWKGSLYYLLGRLYFARNEYHTALRYLDSSLLPKYNLDDRFYGYQAIKPFFRNLVLVAQGDLVLGNEMIQHFGARDFAYKKKVYKEMYEYCERIIDYQKAYRYYKEYVRYSDSLKLDESNKIIAEIQHSYTLKDKEAQINIFQVRELEQQKEQHQFKTNVIIVLLILLLVISVLIGVARQIQTKRKSEKQILVTELYKVEESLLMEQEQQHTKIAAQKRHIAEDMHDEISSSLAAFKFYISDLKFNAGHDETKKTLGALETESGFVYQQVRNFMHNLKASQVSDNFDAVILVDELCKRFCNGKILLIKSDVDRNPVYQSFNNAMHRIVYLVIKEAVANCIKYSGADRINIGIKIQDGRCEFYVEDNGRGFNVDDSFKNGIGLKSMQKRLKTLQGTLQIDSGKSGTVVKGVFSCSKLSLAASNNV
ncbi:MAG: hypothetical protein JST86_06720 [Bacteroidetes bacterium]|nr:hypothetical protein [Bacteroidota bacterium]